MARQGWGRHTTVATGSDSGDQVSVNAWNADIDKDGMLGFTGETIASATSVTPTNSTIILSGSTNVSTIAQGNSAEYDLLYVFTSGSVTLVNTASPSSAGDIKLLANVNKDLSQTTPTILIRKGTAWYEYGGGITNSLNDIGDVVITSVANEDVLAYDTTTSKWINQSADETGRITASSTTTFTNKSIDLTDNTLTGTSAELKTAISDETGSGSLVFATSPTLITPALGTPASGTLTNCTFPTLNQSTSGNAATSTTSTNVTVADESTDTSCNVLFTTAATGALPPKSGTNLTFNSNTGILTATGFAGPLTGNVTGNASGSSGSTTGNAATVTTNANLTGGVTSVGNAATVVTNANLTGDVTSTGNATTLGTVVATKGGTNITTYTTGDLLYASGSNTLAKLAAGTNTHVLTLASGVPTWAAPAGGAATIVHAFSNTTVTTYTGTASSFGTVGAGDRDIYIKKIDTNNEGVFTKIWKNGAAVEVQIA
jgi:hypothetical protein